MVTISLSESVVPRCCCVAQKTGRRSYATHRIWRNIARKCEKGFYIGAGVVSISRKRKPAPFGTLRACEKIVASEDRLRSAGAQDRFAGSETAREPRRGESPRMGRAPFRWERNGVQPRRGERDEQP